MAAHPHNGSTWWAPHRASWWIGTLFAVGSACFLIAPFPGFLSLVGATADGATFFVGSLFFTSAAALQYVQAGNADRAPAGAGRRRLRIFAFAPRRIDWWAAAVQLAGTVFFNISTFDALSKALDDANENRLVWTPDVFGSVCFLVSGFMAYAEVRGGPRRGEWWIAVVNLWGCVLFGVAAVASYFVPSTGTVLDLAAANFTTALGALCFLAGSILLLRDSAPLDGHVARPAVTSQGGVTG